MLLHTDPGSYKFTIRTKRKRTKNERLRSNDSFVRVSCVRFVYRSFVRLRFRIVRSFHFVRSFVRVSCVPYAGAAGMLLHTDPGSYKFTIRTKRKRTKNERTLHTNDTKNARYTLRIVLVNHINLHKSHSNNNTILYCTSIEPGSFVIG
jgi:hypothetical protein